MRGVLIGAQPLPLALAHGEGFAPVHPPEEAGVGGGVVLSGEEGEEIGAVEGRERGGARGSGGGEGGG